MLCINELMPPSTTTDLTAALIQVWEEIAQDTICWLIRSMHRCLECIQTLHTHRDHTHSWVPLWVAMIKLEVGSACDLNFALIFGVILNPALNDDFGFHLLNFFLNKLYDVQVMIFSLNNLFIRIWWLLFSNHCKSQPWRTTFVKWLQGTHGKISQNNTAKKHL